MKLTLAFCAKHGSWSTRVNGILFVLSHNMRAQGTCAEQEYMVIARLRRHPNGYIVEPATSEFTLIEHTGFETSGSMCRTRAYPKISKLPSYITPGRVEPLLNIANNVNPNWSMPIWDQAELDGYRNRGDWNQDNWWPNAEYDATKRGIIGWYKVPNVKPVPGAVFVKKGERRAAGLPIEAVCPEVQAA